MPTRPSRAPFAIPEPAKRSVPADAAGPVSARPAANGSELLEPVRLGLERVEAKLRRSDSTLFAPLANAFLTLIGSGGKRMRPALALLAAEFNGGMQPSAPAYEQVIALAASVEMLHTSTLVHDDVIDGALLRRGAPTLNALWSRGATVLAGNYMFGTAAQLSVETGSMRVIHIFTETLKTIVDGELRQLLDRFAYDQPRERYDQRIYAKTASLFCAATEGAALLSGLGEEPVRALRDYGYNLGMAFQIVDDILDFTGDESTLGKPAGSDLYQGTLTLPFFYFLRQQPDADALIARLDAARDHAETTDDSSHWRAAVGEMVRALRTSSAVAQARADAEHYIARARASLSGFPDTVYKRSMLGLCDFVVERTF